MCNFTFFTANLCNDSDQFHFDNGTIIFDEGNSSDAYTNDSYSLLCNNYYHIVGAATNVSSESGQLDCALNGNWTNRPSGCLGK